MMAENEYARAQRMHDAARADAFDEAVRRFAPATPYWILPHKRCPVCGVCLHIRHDSYIYCPEWHYEAPAGEMAGA